MSLEQTGRNQVTITLGDGAYNDYKFMASKLGISLATLIREKVDEYHQSPSCGALLRRLKESE